MYPYQQQIDHQHLRLLAMFHYVLAGLLFLGAFFIIAYIGFMAWIMNQAAGGSTTGPASGAPPPEFAGVLMMAGIFYGLFALFALANAIGNIFAGMYLQRRRHKLFLMIVAGANCINLPVGTILGVFTFIVLMRPSVAAEFDGSATA